MTLLDLAPRQPETPRDLLGAVGPPLLQAVPEDRLAGGQDEDQDGFRNQAPDAQSTLGVDVEEDVVPALRRLLDRSPGRAVEVPPHHGPFDELPLLPAALE